MARLIPAIKIMREVTNCNLRQGKDAAEAIVAAALLTPYQRDAYDAAAQIASHCEVSMDVALQAAVKIRDAGHLDTREDSAANDVRRQYDVALRDAHNDAHNAREALVKTDRELIAARDEIERLKVTLRAVLDGREKDALRSILGLDPQPRAFRSYDEDDDRPF